MTSLQKQAGKVRKFRLLGILISEQIGHVMFKTHCVVVVLNLYIFWWCPKLSIFFLHLQSLSSQQEHWMKKQPLMLWIQCITLPTAAINNTKPKRGPADFGRTWSTKATRVHSNHLVGSTKQNPSSPSQFPDGAYQGKEEIWLPVTGQYGATEKAMLLFHIVLLVGTVSRVQNR